MNISPEQLDICLTVLRKLADAPTLGGQQDRLKSLITRIHRKIQRTERKKQQQHDRQLRAGTAIVQKQFPHLQGVLTSSLKSALPAVPQETLHLHQPQSCYICKRPYTQIHQFYHLLCPECAVKRDAKLY